MNEAAKPLYDGKAGGTASAARHYVNHIDLHFTLSEVRIDFGQEFADSDAVRSQCNLVTSPVHLRRMGQEISATITSYETRFGAIPLSESNAEDSGAVEDGDG
jgi:Protein of unknown function (DUF3467)